jgi:hypothetical protein
MADLINRSLYLERAARWRRVAASSASARMRTVYVELAVAYERLAATTQDDDAADGQSETGRVSDDYGPQSA